MDSGSSASDLCRYDGLPCDRVHACLIEGLKNGKHVTDVCSRFRAGSKVSLIDVYFKRER